MQNSFVLSKTSAIHETIKLLHVQICTISLSLEIQNFYSRSFWTSQLKRFMQNDLSCIYWALKFATCTSRSIEIHWKSVQRRVYLMLLVLYILWKCNRSNIERMNKQKILMRLPIGLTWLYCFNEFTKWVQTNYCLKLSNRFFLFPLQRISHKKNHPCSVLVSFLVHFCCIVYAFPLENIFNR